MVGYFTVVEKGMYAKGKFTHKERVRNSWKRGKAIAERTIGCLRVYKICGTAERKEIFTF